MSNGTSVYEQTRKLATDLRSEKLVNKRREIGNKLHQLLTKVEHRRRLAVEATPRRIGPDDFSAPAQRCISLSQLWTLVLMGAINVAQTIATGKSKAKRTISDIELPHKLLVACTEDDGAFKNEGLAIPKVTRKTLRSLLNYCLNLLGDEEVSDEVEEKMLAMLNFLCSKPEFVTNFKYTTDFQNVMSELNDRLSPDIEGKNKISFELAAKSVATLFDTCRSIGIDLHMFVPDTLNMVSNWCKHHIFEKYIDHGSDALRHLYNLTSCLMDCYPDISIGPVMEFGRPILSYCKRCYSLARDKNKEALNNYLFSHLTLAQFAGKIQGLAPGDLGDIGKSSLKDRQLGDILQLVLADVTRFTTSLQEQAPKSKRRRDYIWEPIRAHEHKRIDLGARLVACSQRSFMSKVGWDAIGQDNVTDNLLDKLKVPGPIDGEWIDPVNNKDEDCPVSIWKECPWMKWVARGLMTGISKDDLTTVQTSNIYPESSMVDQILNDLDALEGESPLSPLAALAIITACAERFPGGQCWSSNAFCNWHRIVPVHTDRYNAQCGYYIGCTPDNLAALILLLGVLLHCHGGPQGNIQLQCCILHTLKYLTESCSILYQDSHNDLKKTQQLGLAWRSIWKILFAPDLSYQAATSMIARDSLGDLVLSLLKDIVEKRCTDPPRRGALTKQSSFVFENQSDLWNLPAFKQAHVVQSAASFELICRVLSEAGLSNSGSDCIDAKSLIFNSSSTQLGRGGQSTSLSRRRRLLCFALDCLDRTLKAAARSGYGDDTIQFRTAVVVACILSLVSGKGPAHKVSRDEDGQTYRRIMGLRSQEADMELRVQLSPLDIMESALRSGRGCNDGIIHPSHFEFQETGIHSLWKGAEEDVGEVQKDLFPPYHDTIPTLAHQVCREYAFRRRTSSAYADFVSDTESADLNDLVTDFIKERLYSLGSDDYDELDDKSLPAESECLLAESETPSFSQNSATTTTESLASQILSVKFELSLLVWCSRMPGREDFERVVPKTISFMERACFNLLRTAHCNEFLSASRGLVQICRTLSDISCNFQIGLAEASLNGIKGVCKSVLEAYATHRRKGMDLSITTSNTPLAQSGHTESADDFMEDDEVPFQNRLDKREPAPNCPSDDESSHERSAKKRKRRTDKSDYTDHKRFRYDDLATALTLDSTKHIALLLLIIDPSPSTAQFVCESILGTELDIDPESINGDMDLRLPTFCACLLNQPNVFLFQTSENRRDNLQLVEETSQSNRACDITTSEIVCRIVDLVRACASTSWPVLSFGYNEILPFLKWDGRLNYGYSISESEARRLTEILGHDKDIACLPRLRAIRLRACTRAFEVASNTFHQHFDKGFANTIIAGLQDTCSFVRHAAYDALGAALRCLDEQRTLRAVEKILPPVSTSSTGLDDPTFKKWFEASVFCRIEDDGLSKGMGVDDAKLVMEAESVLCKSKIAGCAQSDSLFIKQLFDIIMMSSNRPDLGFVCFQALERTATIRGYAGLENMIDCEGEGLVNIWIENDRKDLPLVLTAPGVLRSIIYRGMPGANDEEKSFIDHPTILQEAARHFVERYRHVLVPLALFRSLARAPTSLNIGENRERDIAFLETDSNFQTICSLRFQQGTFTKNLVALIRRHLPDLHGFCLPILKWEKAGERCDVCARMLAMVNSVLSSTFVESQCSKQAYLIVRSIFDMIGKSELLSGLLPDGDDPYFEAIVDVIQKHSTKMSTTGDMLISMGTSATEMLLRGAVRLNNSDLSRKQRQSWRIIKLQCHMIIHQIKKRDRDQIQLGFCIHMLTEALLKMNKSPVRPLIFSVLVDTLKNALDNLEHEDLRRELSPVLQRLIAACFHIHESCQNVFLRACRSRYCDFAMTMWRSSGLLRARQSSQVGSAWGWETETGVDLKRDITREALNKYGKSIECGVRDGITRTFEVLNWIFDNNIELEINARIVACTGPPYSTSLLEQNLLADFDYRFSAQDLALKFIQRLGHSWDDIQTDTEFLVTSSMSLLANRQAWMDTVVSSGADGESLARSPLLHSLNTDQRLLYSTLCQLERALRKQLSFDSKLTAISKVDLERLVRELSFVCGAFCPEELRIAASRCLGRIENNLIANLSLTQGSDDDMGWLKEAVEDEVLLPTMQSRCVDCLAKSLMSPDPRVALTAAETIATILGGDAGSDLQSMLEKSKTYASLEPFMKQCNDFPRRFLPLSRSELDSLQERCGLDVDERDSDAWCWNLKLWQCLESEHSFENWVCNVTTAVIFCCCSDSIDSSPAKKCSTVLRRSEHDIFLFLCQRICFLEHGFCVSIFPYLVRVLLDDRSDQETVQRLSTAFGMLINGPDAVFEGGDVSKKATVNTKALSLIIDTLDFLRLDSQHEFLRLKHKINTRTLGERSHGTSTPNRKKSPGKKDGGSYNLGLPPTPSWPGTPFGIMVSLDGIIVARACIQARRFASALFFLELHLNAQLGKSCDIFGAVSDQAIGKAQTRLTHASDISGKPPEIDATKEPKDAGKEYATKTFPVMEMLWECFEGLHESENAEVSKAQQESMRFFGGERNSCDWQNSGSNSIDLLRQLNNTSLSTVGLESTYLRTAGCLEDIGIHRVLQTYIDGLGYNPCLTFTPEDAAKLRDAWFRSYLCTAQWEKIDDVKSCNEAKGIHASSSLLRASPDEALEVAGFFESISRAFDSFSLDDMESCRSLLLEARMGTLDGISQTVIGESPLVGLVGHTEKLRAIGYLERLAEGTIHISELCETLGIEQSSPEGDNLNYYENSTERTLMLSDGSILDSSMQGFTFKMPELVVRALLAKKLPYLVSKDLSDLLVSYLWKVTHRARRQQRPGLAQETIQNLRMFMEKRIDDPDDSLPSDALLSISMEEANIFECRGDFKTAIQKSGQIIDLLNQREEREGELESHVNCLLADAQISCGRWMAKYKVREAEEVVTSYQLPGAKRAFDMYSTHKCKENAQRATNGFLEVGKMVSDLYDALFSRTQSLEHKQTANSIVSQEKELHRCAPLVTEAVKKVRAAKAGRKNNYPQLHKEWQDLELYCQTLRKDTERKKDQCANLEKALGKYLNLAIDSFGKALSIAGTDEKDDMSKHVFRMTSLWFSQSSGKERDGSINNLVAKYIKEIPSFRFVRLTNQLFARIELSSTDDDNGFQTTLHALVLQMCQDHPYHTIVPLIALSNSKNVGSGVSGRNADAFLENVGESKVRAATDIIVRLKKDGSEFVGNLVNSCSNLIDSYNHLANASTNAFQGKLTKNIPFSKVFPKSVRALDKFDRMDTPPCVFTVPPPIQADTNYGTGSEDPVGAERVARFEKQFHITETGLHRPKIVICVGTKGGKFRQLVKGEDEIRQDAIMSQIFDYVNAVVARKNSDGQRDTQLSASKRRIREQLRMVTYHVVPLSPASGVLEWVEDTLPFGDYISDKVTRHKREAGAHSRYYPGEWSSYLCRTHFGNSPPNQRRQSFDEVCARFSPVFRFFFVERFGHCMQRWHAARMKFTRSVAVSSIVGHVLGIGDRHTSNILVHQKTGEVVHIDFGIVFEQGKLLNTPERVPFRLTRNMIDGMGPCGTEGAFVNAAEETTRVLRSNASDLLTILSAVVSDPLYKWTVSPVKANRRQVAKDGDFEDRTGEADDDGANRKTETGEDQNKAGAVALAKIKEKLQGYEDSTSGEQQGIASQVTFLVNAARDPDHLCKMFAGWGPWI